MIRTVDQIPSSRLSAPDVLKHLERTLDERWRRYRKAFAGCRKVFSEDSVHQLRVETRRLLALLDLLDSLVAGKELRALRRALKKFFRSFARLRDTQVHLLFVDQHRRKFPEVGPFAKALARLEKRLVGKLDRKIRRTGRREIKELVTALREVLDRAIAEAGLGACGQDIVTQHVRTAFNRAVTLRRRINPDRPQTIHNTRVAFKRFRYLMELLQPLLPGVSLRHLQEMHDHQTLMGDIQDLEVLQGALDEFAISEPEAAQEMEHFRNEIGRQHTARIERYMRAADQLLHFWPVKPPSRARNRSVREGRITSSSVSRAPRHR